jgi:hypothetical protein
MSEAGKSHEPMCVPEDCTWCLNCDGIVHVARRELLTRKQGLEKTIPDTPKGQTPIHLRDKQIYADRKHVLRSWEKDVGIRKDGASQPS